MSPGPEGERKNSAETASLGLPSQAEGSIIRTEDSASLSEDSSSLSEDSASLSEDSVALIGSDSTVTKGTAFARTQSESASAQALSPSLYLPSGNDPACLAKMSGWNWGACAFHGIWMYCFGMQLMGIIIFLATAFIPCAAFVIPIYLGVKGDDLAWRNRHFESFEQFREVIGIWNRWGIGFIVVTSTMAIGLTALLCWYLWQFVQILTPQMCI